MKLRLGICCFLSSLAPALAQQQEPVMLEPVTVYGLPEEKYLTGSSVHAVDSSFLVQRASRHLGETLSFLLPVYFRNYGSGMISGISMRGMAPSHTAVLWNGLSINSFSLGQADFSMLPGIAFTDVKVHEGGGSARYGSGAFGGTVLLGSSGNDEKPLLFIQDAGSFGRFFTALKGHADLGRLQLSPGAYYVRSENNFPIPGRDEKQPHAAYHQEGFTQDIRYRWSSSQELSMHYWYHQSDREIQPPVGQLYSRDEQQDRNHRLQIRYRQHNEHGIFNVSAGLTDDVIVYNGSKSEVFRIAGNADHQYTFANGIHTQAGVNWNHITGKIRNYPGGKAAEHRGDIFASAQKDFGKRLSIALNIRQPFVQGFSSPFLPYLGVEYALLKEAHHGLSIRANASRNFRVPTLNDRYWVDAGNLDLLPETSHAAEAGVNWRYHTLEVSTALFVQRVDNWIQWVPDGNGVYRPRNVKEVRSRGLEVKAQEKIAAGEDFRLSASLSYQLTESITTEAPAAEQYTVGKQLIYTPRHTGSSYLITQWRQWQATIGVQYAGKRYTDASNAETYTLDAFALTEATAGRCFLMNRHRFNLQLTVKNIFDKAYQLYSGRAQPGRSFNVQLIWQLNKSPER